MPRGSCTITGVVLACLFHFLASASADKAKLAGRVLLPDGQPAGQCSLYVSYQHSDSRAASLCLPTDGTGAFSATLDDVLQYEYPLVAATQPGMALGWARALPGMEIVVRVLAAPVACRGVVMDPEGAPIAGTSVSVTRVKRALETHWSQFREQLRLGDNSPLRAVTDAQGRFSIPGLPQGATVTLRVSAKGRETATFDDTPAGSADAHLYLRPEATITGRVTREGQPVAGVTVRLGYADNTALTGANGVFTLGSVPPGVHSVRADGTPDGLVAPAVTDIRVATGEHSAGIELKFGAAGVVTGRCTDAATGAPVAGVEIYARSPDYPRGSRFDRNVFTDADGVFSARVPPGEIELYARMRFDEPPLWRLPDTDRFAQVSPGETVRGLDFTIERQPLVRGIVYGPNGKPAEGAQVGTITRIGYAKTPPAHFFEAVTDREGSFALPVLALRGRFGPPFGIAARDVSHGLAGMALTQRADQPADISLEPAAWFVTRVQDPQGRPIPGVSASVRVGDMRDWLRTMPGGCSDETGELRLGPLPPRVDVAFVPWDSWEPFIVNLADFAGQVYRLQPGETMELPHLTLDLRGRTVHGWVGDAAQRPVADAQVFGEGALGSTTTDATGHFTLGGLPLKGKVRIVAVHPTRPLFAGTVLDPDWGFEPGLILGPVGTAIGRVVDAKGQPVPTAQLKVTGETELASVHEHLANRLYEAGDAMYWFGGQDGRWRATGFVTGLAYALDVFDRHGKLASEVLQLPALKPGDTVDLGDVALKNR